MPQEISLRTTAAEAAKTRVVIWPSRYVRKTYGTPVRAHTLRYRLDRFVQAVTAQDPSAAIQTDAAAAEVAS